jgi:hypothetical protein
MCDSNGNWKTLTSYRYSYISAAQDGYVYAIMSDHVHVLYINSNGNVTSLGSPNAAGYGFGATSPAALTPSGANEVFVIGADKGIYVNEGTSPWGWRLVDHSAQFASLSVNQNGTLYALTVNGHLHVEVWDPLTSGWSSEDISSGRTYQEISAGVSASGYSEVYAIDSSNHSYVNTQQWSPFILPGTYSGSWTTLDTVDLVYDISGAGGGYYFDVTLDTNPNSNYYGYFFDFQFNPDGSSSYIGYELL